ncbi:hypothetical protein RRF57_004916 [Xylaria bambusicola]|uniref:Uncharacterized protein n=1 Tax=Xylaria bambusicola TaxID=326684 RepID=A0AAN7UPL8_9PEZI
MNNNLRPLLVGADGLLPRIEWLVGKLEEIEVTNSNIGDLNARVLLTLLQNNCNDLRQIVDREQISLRTGNEELERGKAELESGQRQLATGQEALKADKERLEGEKQVLAAERESLDSEKDRLEAGKTELEAIRIEWMSEKEAFLVTQTAVEGEKEELEEARQSLGTDKARLDEAKGQLEADRLSLRAQTSSLEQKKRALDEMRINLNTDSGTLADERRRLEDEASRLDMAKQQLDNDTTALDNTRHQLEADKVRLDEKRKAIETSTAAQQELGARWDGKIDSILGELKDLNLSTGTSLKNLGTSIKEIKVEVNSLAKAEKDSSTSWNTSFKKVQESLERFDEAFKMVTDNQIIAFNHEEELTRLKESANRWTNDRRVLELERDGAIQGLNQAMVELDYARQLGEGQARRLEAMNGRVEEARSKVESMTEELDRVRNGLVSVLGGVEGDEEEADVTSLLGALISRHTETLQQRDELQGQISDETRMSRQADMTELMERTEVAEGQRRRSMKRKSDLQSGTPQKRRKFVMEWNAKVENMASFLAGNVPVPDPDGSISELRALYLLVGVAMDESMTVRLKDCLEKSVPGQWYCLDEVVFEGFGQDAEIDGRGCYRHHDEGKTERCYQIKKEVDEDGTVIVVCRMRTGEE